ncbi:MAG: secondary thiamine-phosphate synthase enzyme YjbQ [Hyphomicrobiales bacterium]
MIAQKEISLPPMSRGFHIITDKIIEATGNLPVNGIMNIFVKHTSAGIFINENADPSVRFDFETVFNKVVPEKDPDYTHVFEGDDDMPAHIKSAFTGCSINIPITNGQLNLGTWQGIYFGEYRNRGGARKLIITIYS